jgi:CHAD domain-containing protein
VASEHLEVERKFDVEADFALPALGGAEGVAAVDDAVEHRLEAVYHDTADLRLLQARVTLRRRVGGVDEGWHLKLPAGSARRELHVPLGRAVKSPPKGFLAPVSGILRGARTGPVATLRTRRLVSVLRDADGRALAEVADDSVTATTAAGGPDEPAVVQTWREVEVELVAGDEHLLATVGQLLEDAGARRSVSASKVGRVLAGRVPGGQAADGAPPADPDTKARRPRAGEFVLAAIRQQVGDLQQADVLVRTEQPDAVHQLRVAARRLRSTLAAFRAVLDPAATAPVREELAWLGRQLSDARDDEVALAHLREVVAGQPGELVLGPVAARIEQTAIREARQGLDRALLTLAEARYLRVLDILHELLDEPPLTDRADAPLRPVLRKALARAVRRLSSHMETARQAPDPERHHALHNVRKAAKRVRYAAEIAAGELGSAKALVKAAKRMQTGLGELQDSVVTREHCRRFGITAFAAGENTFTYGRLHALEQARAEAGERDFWQKEPRVRRVLERATS